MNAVVNEGLELRDYRPRPESFLAQVMNGLKRRPRMLPAKLLYDRIGSELFERICELKEYYPTRTETAILQQCAGQMAELCGPRCVLVELGSGSSTKTRMLLDRLNAPAVYVPVDISRDQLIEAAVALNRDYRELQVVPVCADYTAGFRIPRIRARSGRTVVFFPGSTIGNFEPGEALRFLRAYAQPDAGCDAMIVGVDLRKARSVLEPAYNDKSGVTAAFNLNLLRRINRELGADFVLSRFQHRAVYNDEAGRIEMHLVSGTDQIVRLSGAEIALTRGESIVTEHSYKYTIQGFARLAEAAGFTVGPVWTDSRNWFSVFYLEL